MKRTNTVYEWESLPVVLTVTDVCRVLKISEQTARAYLRDLNAVKVGRSFRIGRDKLRQALEG